MNIRLNISLVRGHLYFGLVVFGIASLAQVPDQSTDQIIVKFKRTHMARVSVTQTIHRHLTDFKGIRQITPFHHVVKLNHFKSLKAIEQEIETLKFDSRVAYAEPDYIRRALTVPNDTLYSRQWHYSESLGGINLPSAWGQNTGSSSVVVAVLDTGILYHHDIATKVLPGYDFIGDTANANDGNGWDSDATDPGDLGGDCSDAEASTWHGTHVAGTISAETNNAVGVAGVNWRAKILPIRVLGVCGGYDSEIVTGMRLAAGLSVGGIATNPSPAKVINLSLGGAGSCTQTWIDAITDVTAAGSTIVVAAGNSNVDLAVTPYTPASCAGIITVAATERYGGRSSYSNYGTTIEIAAPGGSMAINNDPNGILSLGNLGVAVAADDYYPYFQGTSMATPHVAGVVSLMLSVNSSLTPANVLTMLQSSARTFPTPAASVCTVLKCGSGIVDANSALIAARGNLSSSPGYLTFPETELGQEATQQRVTLANTSGGTTIVMATVSLIGEHAAEYTMESDSCSGVSLAPGAACTIAVSFQPTAPFGNKNASLRIPSNALALDTIPLVGQSAPNSQALDRALNSRLLDDKKCVMSKSASRLNRTNELKYVRRFRDHYLVSHGLGKTLAATYYQSSAQLFDTIENSATLRWFADLVTRIIIDGSETFLKRFERRATEGDQL